jgi:S1-C subfamily serine protease
MAEEKLLTSLCKEVSPSVVQLRITPKVEREASSPFREWPGPLSFPYLPVCQCALVIGVTQDSPADKAGLQGSDRAMLVDGVETQTGGDVIVGVRGERMNGIGDLLPPCAPYTTGPKTDLGGDPPRGDGTCGSDPGRTT